MKHHVSQSIRGALWNRQFADFQWDDGTPMGPQEAFNSLCDELAMGHEVIPVAECDNFDPKKGCLGHPETLTETLGKLRTDLAPQPLTHSTAQPEPVAPSSILHPQSSSAKATADKSSQPLNPSTTQP